MKYLYFLGILIGSSISIHASCSIKNSNELLTLIKANHPTIERNNSRQSSLQLELDKAKTRPNPELESEITTGETESGNSFNTGISIKHTFELGGKRDSRIELANSYIRKGKEVSRFENENALIDSVLKIQRLSQIYELIPLYKEAASTLELISKRMRKRKSLSPQEEVEKETLALATNDYQLKLGHLYAEKLYLNKHLSLFAGIDCEITEKILSEIGIEKRLNDQESTTSYSKLKAAKSNLDFAKSQLTLQKSLAIPDLSIGPVYEYEKLPHRVNHKFGITFNMDLPVFNSNESQKSIAANDITTASIQLRNTIKESQLDLLAWKEQYNRYLQSLKRVSKKEELEIKHQKIEKLFSRGIISTSLVIESHRQLLEFTNTRQQFESGALEALWNIYELTGTINSKKL